MPFSNFIFGLKASPRKANFFALLTGILLTLAFSPISWFPLAFVSMALLWMLLDGLDPKSAAMRAFFFGLGFFGSGVSWIYVSIHEFGESPWWAASLLTLLLISFLSSFSTLTFYVVHRFTQDSRQVRWTLLYPAAWTLTEWIRGWLFTGFPWLNLGYSQTDAWLIGYAPVLGVYGVSFGVALTAGLLASLWVDRSKIRYLLPLGLMLWTGGYWLDQHQWTTAVQGVGVESSDKIKVAVVQGNISQQEKWEPSNLENTLTLYRTFTEKNWDADLIVWPETAIPEFVHEIYDSFLVPLTSEAQSKGKRILTGVPVLNTFTQEYTNSATLIGEPQLQLYHKRHLVPFGEYVPLDAALRDFIEQFLKIPMSGFTKGKADQTLMQFDGHPVGTNICYEIAFGEELIEDLPDAQLLVTLSNNAWFGDSFAPFQILQMAQFRAREVERDLILSTNDGVTAIINAKGEVQQQLPQFVAGVLRGEVQLRSGSTPYVKWGNPLIISLLSIILLIGLWILKFHKSAK